MGLFGSTKIYVSSTLYNLAGDIEKRPDYLKTLVVGNTITNNPKSSYADSFREGYQRGPGLKFRNFYLWAEDNYNQVGIPHGNIAGLINLPANAVAAQIPHNAGEEILIQSLSVDIADYSFWSDRYMLENYPDLVQTGWTADIDELTNLITITFEDTTTVSFNPSGFQKGSAYIFATYLISYGSTNEPVQEGPEVTLTTGQSFPSISGWMTVTNTSVPHTMMLQKIVTTTKTYSDGRPPETSSTNTTTNPSYNEYHGVFMKEDYQGSTSGEISTIKSTMYQDQVGGHLDTDSETSTTEDIGGGVTRTTKVHTYEETLALNRTYKVNTQKQITQDYSPAKVFIYRIGSGNTALDNLVTTSSDGGDYFPFIPVRLNNQFLSNTNYPEAFEQASSAYKRTTGAKLDDLIADLQSNKDLKDMDYVYVMFGASLNTKENTAKKYLYNLFRKFMLTQSTDESDYNTWEVRQVLYAEQIGNWNAWQEAQSDPTSPLYNTPEPVVTNPSGLPESAIRISASGNIPTNVDMQITWQSMTEISGTGLRKPGAKKDEYWIEFIGRTKFPGTTYSNGVVIPSEDINVDRLAIHHQINENSYKSLIITGLTHRNYIYKGKYVETTAKDALEDAEESSFLVPLHYETFRELGIVDYTQMSTACCYLVINSYLVKKTGFFGSTFFKFILVVAVVAITIATGGAGAFSAGILGSSAAVGAAVGLTGFAALLVGAIANVIAAMIVTKLITAGAMAVFGDKIGAIIGAIASYVAITVGSNIADGGSLSTAFSSLGNASNLINLSMAAGSGFAGYIAASTADLLKQTQQVQDDYNKEANRISELFAQNFGYGTGTIDPLDLTNAPTLYIEDRDTFLSRTLMTGSDIAEISIGMLGQFADITLKPTLAF